MRLQLTRPLVFFDLETTGTNVRQDRIVEYCFTKIFPDQRREMKSGRVNPRKDIPREVAEIHGITNETVKDCPLFQQVAPEIADFLKDCDLAGFNIINFDIPMLSEEFKRSQIDFDFDSAHLVDAQKIFFRKEPRTLSAALRFYCDKEHSGAHGADADVGATIDVLEAQVNKYDDVPATVPELARYCSFTNPGFVEPSGRLRWLNGEVVIGFGQKNGQSLKKLAAKEKNFLKWILANNFSLEVKAIVQDALEGKFPEKPKS